MNVNISYSGNKLNPNATTSPCGLQSKLFFKDEYRIFKGKKQIFINRSLDRPPKFKKQINSKNSQWIDPTSNVFEIWMQTSTSSKLRKYYGNID